MNLHTHEPIQVSDERLVKVQAHAIQALDAAREITMRWFRQSVEVDDKRVTRADREAEACIRQILFDADPEIGFLGEETGGSESQMELVWVVDPIDGTRAYVSGMPMWGTLIALFDGRKPLLGFLDQPVLDERYVGHAQGAYLLSANGRQQLQSRQGRSLDEAVLYCTAPEMFGNARKMSAFERVRSQVSMSRFGGDCYAYAMLASGHVDVIIECELQPYDIQALIPIVEGAGGVLSDWQGGSAAHGGCVVASGSAALHEQVLALLNQDPSSLDP